MVCADNTVVIPMRACDRGKSEARGARSAEGAPCEGRFVVRVRSCALTGGKDQSQFFVKCPDAYRDASEKI